MAKQRASRKPAAKAPRSMRSHEKWTIPLPKVENQRLHPSEKGIPKAHPWVKSLLCREIGPKVLSSLKKAEVTGGHQDKRLRYSIVLDDSIKGKEVYASLRAAGVNQWNRFGLAFGIQLSYKQGKEKPRRNQIHNGFGLDRWWYHDTLDDDKKPLYESVAGKDWCIAAWSTVIADHIFRLNPDLTVEKAWSIVYPGMNQYPFAVKGVPQVQWTNIANDREGIDYKGTVDDGLDEVLAWEAESKAKADLEGLDPKSEVILEGKVSSNGANAEDKDSKSETNLEDEDSRIEVNSEGETQSEVEAELEEWRATCRGLNEVIPLPRCTARSATARESKGEVSTAAQLKEIRTMRREYVQALISVNPGLAASLAQLRGSN